MAGVAGGAALAACGGASATPGAQGTAQTAGSAQSGGPRTLPPASVGWDTFRGGPDGVWAKHMVKTFEDRHPGVRVEYRPIALDGGNQQSAYPKMYTMAAAGTLGDVFAWDPSHWNFYQAIKRGLLKPADAYITRDKYDTGQFYKPYVEYQKWEGKTWGLPSWGSTGQAGLLYNPNLVQQAGATLPAQNSPQWTLDALRDAVLKVHRLVGQTGGFGISTRLPAAAGVTVFARAFDSDNLSPDGKRSQLLEPNVKNAMRWAHDLANRDQATAVPGKFEGNADQLFVAGKLGFIHSAAGDVFRRNRENKDGSLVFKAILFPKRKDGKHPSQLRGGTWNTGNQSKLPDHGWELIKHITSREGTLTFNTMAGEGAFTRPDILTDDYFKDPNFRVFIDGFEQAMLHVVPANFRGTEFENAFAKMGNPWYAGEAGFEDGLIAWNTELQRILDLPAE